MDLRRPLGENLSKGKGSQACQRGPVTEPWPSGEHRDGQDRYFFACCWTLKNSSAKTINIGLSESVALASVSEMGGSLLTLPSTTKQPRPQGGQGAAPVQ